MKTHTETPWKVVYRNDEDEDEADIDASPTNIPGWNCDVTILYGISAVNARRIVACVNACEGISNDVLNNICLVSGSLAGRFAELRESANKKDEVNAKLASALQDLLDVTDEPPYRNCSCHISQPCNDCVDFSAVREARTEARDAIAQSEDANP